MKKHIRQFEISEHTSNVSALSVVLPFLLGFQRLLSQALLPKGR